MKILQICSRVPYPPHDGGAIATLTITKNLIKQGCCVHLLAINTPKHFQPDNALSEVAKMTVVFVNTNITYWGLVKGLFGKVPYNIKRFISKKFEEKLVEILKNQSFDIIQFEGLFVAWYIHIVRQYSNVPVILRAHNIEYLIWKRLSANSTNPLKRWYLKKMAEDVKNFEIQYLNQFDLILAISEKDKERMLHHLECTTKIEVIPTGVDLDDIKFSEPGTTGLKKIGFLGSLNWEPNLEGLEWFLNSVWRKLTKHIPSAEFHIAGKGMTEDIKNLSFPNTFFHGFIENSHDFLNSCQLIVVPLLSGSGIRVKIIEGMAQGKCIISTIVGAEGIPVTDGVNIILADRAEVMINKIIQLFSNPDDLQRIGNAARDFIRENYDNKVFIKKLIGIYAHSLPPLPFSLSS